MSRLKDYYILIKPGIVIGNAYHVLAGIFLAYQFDWSWATAGGVLVGTSALIASACVANNYFDRHQDARMNRTKNRPLANGSISLFSAVVFAGLLLIGGLALLHLTTNPLTVILGLIAYISYAFVYTYMKRITAYNTIVGTLPGALPGVAGYVAFSGQLDWMAWLIFIVLAIWQLPHFYAIAIRRRQEYEATEFKFITNSLGKSQMWWLINSLIVAYGIAFVCLGLLTMHWAFVLVIWLACSWWIWLSIQQPTDYTAWAKRVFGGSLVLMMVFMVTTLGNFLLEKLI